MKAKRYFLLGIVLVFVVFVLQNAEMVQIRLLFWKAEAPRVLVLLSTFALGATTGVLLAWRRKDPDRGERGKPRT